MEIKYTKDGKKVAVLGKLNNETWIVQEIMKFVSNNREFPSGENFTTKTLLDEPATTWQSRTAEQLKETTSKLEQKIETLEGKSRILRRKSNVAELINKATEKYQSLDVSELDTLFAFLSGQITHIIIETYSGFEIVSTIDAIESVDNYCWGGRLDGLKLVSLFGCSDDGTRRKGDRSFSLTWRINQYRDGSGSWKKIYPCSSQEEAVSLLDQLVASKEVTEKLILLKEKYGINNPTQKKIDEYKKKRIENKKANIKEAEGNLDKMKAELQALKDKPDD